MTPDTARVRLDAAISLRQRVEQATAAIEFQARERRFATELHHAFHIPFDTERRFGELLRELRKEA